LSMDARIALSLRDVCGMKTEEIASAYLVSSETIKKRISRGKKIFKDKSIPYEIPSKTEMNGRLGAVLHVIYLIFNEGYAASSGDEHIRKELSDEAIFLSRQVVSLLPTPDSLGLLALLLFQESRRESRVTEEGELISLEHQDRSLWDQSLIGEGEELIQQAIFSGRLGVYTLQAAIASVHAVADSVENTQWNLIVDYYDMLLSISPSPFVELNRTIAVAMSEGPEAGLVIVQKLAKLEKLKSYHLIYSIKADLLRRLARTDEAVLAYERAIELARQEPERRYLEAQLSRIANEE